jgi:hypothetical protein
MDGARSALGGDKICIGCYKAFVSGNRLEDTGKDEREIYIKGTDAWGCGLDRME